LKLLSRESPVSGSASRKFTEYTARILFAAIFIFAALGKFVDTSNMQALMESVGIPGLLVWPAAFVDIAIAVSLIFGISWRIMAPLSAIYCVALGIIFHLRPESPNDMVHFAKNLSIAGGLIMIMLRSGRN
jgi:putative oxidoreductase